MAKLIEKIENDEEFYEHLRIVVDKGQELMRIDKFLINRIQNTSRNRIQHAIENKSLLANDKEVKASYKVRPSDIITLVLSAPPREIKLIPENIPLNIVFEDDDLIVVNKPARMVVHPALGNYTGTLVNALLYHTKTNSPPTTEKKKSTNEDIRPFLVHRIDKNTSGLLVVAKNEIALDALAKQFFKHTIDRTYWALAWGNFKNNSGTITGNIGRNPKDRKIMTVFPDGEHGKEAVTHFKVLENLGYVSLVECKLETGRTHQIRVHFKFIGHPLFNDNEYGGDKIVKGTVFTKYKQFVDNCFKIITRQALHAKSLGFIHPRTKKKMYFESPLPDDFAEVLEKWRGYRKVTMS